MKPFVMTERLDFTQKLNKNTIQGEVFECSESNEIYRHRDLSLSFAYLRTSLTNLFHWV